MPIEPHNVRFNIGSMVLPPRLQKPVTKPAIGLEQDAAMIRARFRKVWSSQSVKNATAAKDCGSIGGKANGAKRKEQTFHNTAHAIALRADIVRALVIPMGKPRLTSMFKVSDSSINRAIATLLQEGKIRDCGKMMDQGTKRMQTMFARVEAEDLKGIAA